jgi:hypothetical protein
VRVTELARAGALPCAKRQQNNGRTFCAFSVLSRSRPGRAATSSPNTPLSGQKKPQLRQRDSEAPLSKGRAFFHRLVATWCPMALSHNYFPASDLPFECHLTRRSSYPPIIDLLSMGESGKCGARARMYCRVPHGLR